MALAQKASAKAATPARTPISFADDAMTAGGFLDDQDVEITDAACTVFDYGGTAPANTPVFAVEFTDVNGNQHTQMYSLGGFGKDPEFEPSEDGRFFYPIGGATSITKNSNCGRFIQSLKHGIPNKGDGGFPDEMFASGDLRVIIGTKCHVFAEKQGGPQSVRRDKKGVERDKIIVLVSKVHSLPGTESAGKATGKAAPATKTAAAAAAGGKANGAAKPATKDAATDEIDTVLTSAIIEALGETDPLPKKSLLQIASAAFKGTPSHSKAIARVNSAEFIKSLTESGVSTDGAQFSQAG